MTDKEQFDLGKKRLQGIRNKKRLLKFMKKETNRKMFFVQSEEEYTNLLAELRAIEINDTKVRRNKYGSKAYEFTPVERKRL